MYCIVGQKWCNYKQAHSQKSVSGPTNMAQMQPTISNAWVSSFLFWGRSSPLGISGLIKVKLWMCSGWVHRHHSSGKCHPALDHNSLAIRELTKDNHVITRTGSKDYEHIRLNFKYTYWNYGYSISTQTLWIYSYHDIQHYCIMTAYNTQHLKKMNRCVLDVS